MVPRAATTTKKQQQLKALCLLFFFFALLLCSWATLYFLSKSEHTGVGTVQRRNKEQQQSHRWWIVDDVNEAPLTLARPHSNISMPAAGARQASCTWHSCFDTRRCVRAGRFGVLIYRRARLEGESLPPLSREFRHLIMALRRSRFFVSDPRQACLFVPQVDLLNGARFAHESTSRLLAAMPAWASTGENHLLFSMLPGAAPSYGTVPHVNTSRALLGLAGASQHTLRQDFDVPLIVYNPLTARWRRHLHSVSMNSTRPILLLSTQSALPNYLNVVLRQLANRSSPNEVLRLAMCTSNLSNSDRITYYLRCDQRGREFVYPEVMAHARYCLVSRVSRLAQTALYDALLAGCIPVIIAADAVLPFDALLDWKLFSVRIPESRAESLLSILRNISPEQTASLARYGRSAFRRRLAGMANIGVSTLEIIESRLKELLESREIGFHHKWSEPELHNSPVDEESNAMEQFLLPHQFDAYSQGFTAVVLAYGSYSDIQRAMALRRTLQMLEKAPSHRLTLLVWNEPPANDSETWHQQLHFLTHNVSKAVQIKRMRINDLGNRFIPFDEIQTEAVLSMDDDIDMLLVDELEFGFRVWCEHPRRLVGFPSREARQVLSNSTAASPSLHLRYVAEWTSRVSLVLTGAAFYHKMYGALYHSSAMPSTARDWVRRHAVCEDLTMNFLVAHVSGLAPIKVGPRKKFRCPHCRNAGAGASHAAHLKLRSACLTRLANIFHAVRRQKSHVMPLLSADFRADPVLLAESLDVRTQFDLYNQIGPL